MKIGIVGASGAGLYLAIFLKKKHPDYEVELIDQNDKLAKKIYATGNGRCNLLNISTGPEDYNYPLYMEKILKRYPYETLKKQLNSLGVEVTTQGYYVYPASLSASSFIAYLSSLIAQLGIAVRLSTKVKDYKQQGAGWLLVTDQGNISYDRLAFATGGMSQSNLGSDGSMFPVYFAHGYEVLDLKPGLCPIVTKEKTKAISGIRHHVNAILTCDERIVHQEEGEVLFKDDGLSGIVIFNLESFIAHLEGEHEVKITLDLFPEFHQSELTEKLANAAKSNPSNFLDSFVVAPLGAYVLKKAGLVPNKVKETAQFFALAKVLKGLEFTFSHAYDFAQSQVTVGGVSLNFVNDHLLSRLEKGIAFAGEALDVDGLCGGHNLTWCLISALMVSEGW